MGAELSEGSGSRRRIKLNGVRAVFHRPHPQKTTDKGVVEYDALAKVFHGDIINTRDVITFQGTTVKEIERAFKESIDDYIAWCKEEGVEPEKPYSGKFNVRLSLELHRRTAILARKRNISLNSFVEKAITDEITQLTMNN